MFRRLPIAALLLLAGVAPAGALTVSPDPGAAPSGLYQLEPRHTIILFSIKHLGISDYSGRFDKASGTLNFDPKNPERSSVEITIDTTSLNTPSSELNASLQGQAIFDTAHFPTATFKSTSIKQTSPTEGIIKGELTIKGITNPVVIDATYNGSTPAPMGPAATMIGFHGTTTIRRSDYNMTGVIWSPMVGDDVKLEIQAPFVIKGR